MGYYTDYDFKITGIDNESQADKIIEDLQLLNCETSDDGTELTSHVHDKWYYWKEDVIAVSKVYPRVLFEIQGNGEENGDIWKARIRNGIAEVIHGKIIFDEFKEIC
jgi:hypothetical protein